MERQQRHHPVEEASNRKEACVLNFPSTLIHVIHGHRGLVYGFGSACCYAGMTLTVSALKDDVSSIGLVFVRAIFTLFISSIILIYQGASIRPVSAKESIFHIITGIVSTTAIFCQFYAYHHMRTADASAIIYGYVAFTGLFGRIFLKEAFGFFEAFMILFTLMGTILIARPPFIFGESDIDHNTAQQHDGGILPPLVALGGSISAALVIVILRAMQNFNFHSMKTVFYFSLYTVLITSVPITLLEEWTIPDCITPRLIAVLLGVSSFAGFALLNLGVSVEDAVYISLVTMNEVGIVFLLDILIFGSQPLLLSVLGMLLIVSSSIVTSVKKIFISHRDRKQEEKDRLNEIASSGTLTPCNTLNEDGPLTITPSKKAFTGKSTAV
ncbi:Solute carrier family 35 member G1 [Holothuria leucospilota]|uniref:Solute carrier family 35 member G1 n=1 Tax=Holothuria leucospilota TaxID=206669 RepID=A0A9Q1BCT4_HOLLE|nr:Solute carrier family 35 member G1 [Holothuria leucospilota]